MISFLAKIVQVYSKVYSIPIQTTLSRNIIRLLSILYISYNLLLCFYGEDSSWHPILFGPHNIVRFSVIFIKCSETEQKPTIHKWQSFDTH